MSLYRIILIILCSVALFTLLAYFTIRKIINIRYERKLLKRCVTAVKQIMKEDFYKELYEILNENKKENERNVEHKN